MKTIIPIWGLSFGLLAFATGCISTEKTEFRDQERMKVEFENDAAGRLFYESLSSTGNRQNHAESKTDISIPVVFEHKHRIIEGESMSFNRAVHSCDTNGDGKITELEARIFCENASKQH